MQVLFNRTLLFQTCTNDITTLHMLCADVLITFRKCIGPLHVNFIFYTQLKEGQSYKIRSLFELLRGCLCVSSQQQIVIKHIVEIISKYSSNVGETCICNCVKYQALVLHFRSTIDTVHELFDWPSYIYQYTVPQHSNVYSHHDFWKSLL